MGYEHRYYDDPIWQRHARAALRGNRRSIEWLDKRGWSPQQAALFLDRPTDRRQKEPTKLGKRR